MRDIDSAEQLGASSFASLVHSPTDDYDSLNFNNTSRVRGTPSRLIDRPSISDWIASFPNTTTNQPNITDSNTISTAPHRPLDNPSLPPVKRPCTDNMRAIDNDQRTENSSPHTDSLVEGTLFRKDEMVRLFIQALTDLGYTSSAATLETEAGYQVEEAFVTQFRQLVLEGCWGEVEQLLAVLKIEDNPDVLFIIRQQKFLEQLEKRQPNLALTTLQTELTPLDSNIDRRHFLSSLLVCNSPEEVKAKANWDGATGTSRQAVLDSIQRFVSPSVMLPSRRLQALLNQAMTYQRRDCFYHDSPERVQTLFSDHKCGRSSFPSTLAHVIEDHSNEVWHIAFSNNGRYLASGSKDATAKIWSVETHSTILTLTGHTEAVSYVAWSFNDLYLLTCSHDKVVRLWEAQTGNCLKVLTRHTNKISACAWLPDSLHFVTSSTDKATFLWNLDGTVVHRWTGFVASDLSISRNSNFLAMVANEKISFYDLQTKQETICLNESAAATSITLSSDANYLLCNVANQEIHLWDLKERKIMKRFKGYVQSKFVIRSCFGGADLNYVISGSEDSNVYIWRLDEEVVVNILPGHTKMVNAVSWNSAHGSMLASASDDGTIRIWI